MTKELFYAVNGSGQGCVFTSMPFRDEHMKVWCGEIVGMFCTVVMQLEADGILSLPNLKWTDEPVKLELKIDVCSEEHH